MDLNREVVKHEKFGIGTIVDSQNDYIIVQFHDTKEQKKFLYPESIGEFLELQNKSSLNTQNEDMKDTETKDKGEYEQRRIKHIKGIIKREKGVKKIIGMRGKNKEK